MLTAERLNAHLANGGVVQVTTYLRSTVYDWRHAGWFTEDSTGALYVRQGRSRVCVKYASIRFGRFA